MRRYQRLYEAEKKARNNASLAMDSLLLIHSFLNKHVRVKVDDGFAVEGVLIRYQLQSEGEHRPSLLVLKDGDSFHFIRGNWLSISECERHG
jgi:hypothetical protein